MTLFALGLSYKGELLLLVVFEFAVFSGCFKFFVSSGDDHPVLPTIPETEYFRGFLLEMMPGR